MRPLLPITAVVVCFVAAVPSAHAAFPGRNGLIAFTNGREFTNPVWGISPRTRRIKKLIPDDPGEGFPDLFQFSPGRRLIAFVKVVGARDVFITSATGSPPTPADDPQTTGD